MLLEVFDAKVPRVAYTLEYKLEAVRRVRSGEATRRVAREIGVAEQTLRNWSKAQASGKLGDAEKGMPVTPEQMEISRLRAANARLRMEADPNKNRRVLCEGVAVRYAFIEQHCDSYPLQTLCMALQVSDSGFASWQRAAGPTK